MRSDIRLILALLAGLRTLCQNSSATPVSQAHDVSTGLLRGKLIDAIAAGTLRRRVQQLPEVEVTLIGSTEDRTHASYTCSAEEAASHFWTLEGSRNISVVVAADIKVTTQIEDVVDVKRFSFTINGTEALGEFDYKTDIQGFDPDVLDDCDHVMRDLILSFDDEVHSICSTIISECFSLDSESTASIYGALLRSHISQLMSLPGIGHRDRESTVALLAAGGDLSDVDTTLLFKESKRLGESRYMRLESYGFSKLDVTETESLAHIDSLKRYIKHGGLIYSTNDAPRELFHGSKPCHEWWNRAHFVADNLARKHFKNHVAAAEILAPAVNLVRHSDVVAGSHVLSSVQCQQICAAINMAYEVGYEAQLTGEDCQMDYEIKKSVGKIAAKSSFSNRLSEKKQITGVSLSVDNKRVGGYLNFDHSTIIQTLEKGRLAIGSELRSAKSAAFYSDRESEIKNSEKTLQYGLAGGYLSHTLNRYEVVALRGRPDSDSKTPFGHTVFVTYDRLRNDGFVVFTTHDHRDSTSSTQVISSYSIIRFKCILEEYDNEFYVNLVATSGHFVTSGANYSTTVISCNGHVNTGYVIPSLFGDFGPLPELISKLM